MSTPTVTLSTKWQVTRDSTSDATSYDGSALEGTTLGEKYDYRGSAYIHTANEILIAISSNIPPAGHAEDRPVSPRVRENLDNRTGNGVAFLNPNPSIALGESNPELLAVRFGAHHIDDSIDPQYRRQVGIFQGFELDSVTYQHNGLPNLSPQRYNDLVATRGGTVSYGESTIANQAYFGSEFSPIFNEIKGGNLVTDSGFRYLTPEESAEAKLQFEQQGIRGEYVYGFALSKALIPIGQSTLSLWAECGNDAIAMDLVNIGNPGIKVVKRVNGLDANTPDTAATIENGQKVVYTVELTNNGNVNLRGDNISVNDPSARLFLLPGTDIGGDNILSPGETWSLAAAPSDPLSTTRRRLDFDIDANGNRIRAGDFIENQYRSWGVTISGIGNTSPNNRTMAFDSENPTGGDEDLRTTNQGRVLIISEDNNQANPDDDGGGGTFIFKWDQPVWVDQLGLLDLSKDLTGSAYSNGTLVNSFIITGAGHETQQLEALAFSAPIDELRLAAKDSFAITSLGFNRFVENVVSVTVTDPQELFTITGSDSAFYINRNAETLMPRLALVSQSDLSGDGKSDLLWRNSNDGTNVLWAMDNFAITANTVHSVIEDPLWKIATIADFDGDGNADLLLRHQGAGTNLIRRLGGDGATILGDIQLPDVPDLNWDFTDTADFDGDGDVDILLRHRSAGVNLVWNIDGSGGVESAIALTPIEDPNWEIAASIDFNRDGNADLLLRHQVAGINLIRLMDGFEILGDVQLPDVVGSNLHIEGARDFNGDGNADIVWRNRASGQNFIWELNGTGFVREVALASVDSSWQLVV